MSFLRNLVGTKKPDEHEIVRICRKSQEIMDSRVRQVGEQKAFMDQDPYGRMWSDYAGRTVVPLEIEHMNFSGLFFNHARFKEHHFVECDFSGSRWLMAVIADCSFAGSNFSGAHLAGTPFQRSNFRKCNFTGADLAVFLSLAGNNFEAANFTDAQLKIIAFEARDLWQFNNAVMKGCSLKIEEIAMQKSLEPEEIAAFLQKVFSPEQLASMQITYRNQSLMAPAGEHLSFEASVARLNEIYQQHPEGFVCGAGGAAEQEIRRIGSALNSQGGMDLMLRAHREFSQTCRIPGASRNLEHMWDRIGEWLG